MKKVLQDLKEKNTSQEERFTTLEDLLHKVMQKMEDIEEQHKKTDENVHQIQEDLFGSGE